MTLAFTVAAKQLHVYTLETWFIMIGHQKSYCGATREELVALTQSADTTVLTFTYYVTSLNDSFNLKASIWDEIIGFLAIFLGDTGYCENWWCSPGTLDQCLASGLQHRNVPQSYVDYQPFACHWSKSQKNILVDILSGVLRREVRHLLGRCLCGSDFEWCVCVRRNQSDWDQMQVKMILLQRLQAWVKTRSQTKTMVSIPRDSVSNLLGYVSTFQKK